MSVDTPEELERLEAAGRVVAQAIRTMRAHARPGVSTGELDAIGARVFARAGARSGPQLDYGFPGAVREAGDGWTLKTRDGSWAAHSEHTIVVTTGAPVVLTA
jgi:methionine aminopeptidase